MSNRKTIPADVQKQVVNQKLDNYLLCVNYVLQRTYEISSIHTAHGYKEMNALNGFEKTNKFSILDSDSAIKRLVVILISTLLAHLLCIFVASVLCFFNTEKGSDLES